MGEEIAKDLDAQGFPACFICGAQEQVPPAGITLPAGCSGVPRGVSVWAAGLWRGASARMAVTWAPLQGSRVSKILAGEFLWGIGVGTRANPRQPGGGQGRGKGAKSGDSVDSRGGGGLPPSHHQLHSKWCKVGPPWSVRV